MLAGRTATPRPAPGGTTRCHWTTHQHISRSCSDRASKPSPKVCFFVIFFRVPEHATKAAQYPRWQVFVAIMAEVDAILEVTFCKPSSLSGWFAVGMQSVTQHESITLKLVKPAFTRSFIRSLRIPMNPVSSVVAKFSSFALMQWLLSLQHRENNPRGRGGMMIPGQFPFFRIIGIVFSTIFLKISGGVVTTFPPKWNLPLLWNGRAVVPSYCSKRSELLPNRSKTYDVDTSVSILSCILAIFPGDGVHPGNVWSVTSTPCPATCGTQCRRLLAPTSITFCIWASDVVLFSTALSK